MFDRKPYLKTSFIYNDEVILVDWFELTDYDLPDLPWQQVYAVGGICDLVPVVKYSTGSADNLPVCHEPCSNFVLVNCNKDAVFI